VPKQDVECQLENLSALRTQPVGEATITSLKKALRDRVNVVVAKAAKITAELQLRVLIQDLLAAFERLLENSVKGDPQCWGKNALAKALKDLGHNESAIFLKGARHIQLEPVWGGQADTAAVLRGACALALVQCADIPRDEIFRHLVMAVTETAETVRADAARGLEEMEGTEAILLLRFKARVGDRDPRITGQALESVLHLEGPAAVEFVAGFLDGFGEEVHDEAALALGASRLPAAVAILQERWSRFRQSRAAEILLRAISISRQEAAIEFLLGLVREGREIEAIAALQALEVHKQSAETYRRTEEAVHSRNAEAVEAAFHRHFASPAVG
jgi:hypothetical protein